MKKTLITIFITLLICGMPFQSMIASAQPAPSSGGSVKSEDLFYPFKYTNKEGENKLSYVQKLPSGSWQTILTQVIKFILSITGTLALIAFTYSGILFLTARGEEDQLTKAKQFIVWSIVALAIIALSYALVLGISQLKFFS